MIHFTSSIAAGQACAPMYSPLQSKATGTILIVENELHLQSYIREVLESESYRVIALADLPAAFSALDAAPATIVVDCCCVGHDATSSLEAIRARWPKVPVIVLSCATEPNSIVDAMQSGASGFVVKPFRREQLLEAVQRTAPSMLAAPLGASVEIPVGDNASFVFSNLRMHEIRQQCTSIARVDLPVLILGESGTGKEIISQYIHRTSPRSQRPFLKINCAAMPADLLESELFGFEQGAFTGAVKAKPGKFELCNHGTILLDEIGEMPSSLQAKLLQVLQDGSFSRLGGRSTIQVDVRVLAATNIDMRAAIAEKRFRADLFYRLNGFSIQIPPLRERKDEISTLLHYFVKKLAPKYAQGPVSISDALINACINYSWPGNLRELENFVKRYLVLADERLMIAELRQNSPSAVLQPSNVREINGGLKKMVRAVRGEAEMEAISASLDRNNWNRRRTATELNISYKALLYKIRQYGIEPQKLNATATRAIVNR